MKKLASVFAFVFLFAASAFAWGPTGHRIVGEIAQRKLSEHAAAAIKQILGGHRLADVANWADDIRSDDNYKALPPFHYADIPTGAKSYQDGAKNPKGDTIVAINTLVAF